MKHPKTRFWGPNRELKDQFFGLAASIAARLTT